MKNRLLSTILSIVLIVGLMPVSISAETGDLLFSLNISGNTISDSSNTNNSTVTKGEEIVIDSFVNVSGAIVPYIQFTHGEGDIDTNNVKVSFADAIAADANGKADDITVEFWANISSRNGYGNNDGGTPKAFIMKGSNNEVLKIEKVANTGWSANTNRFQVNKGNTNLYLGTAQNGANVVDTWAHYVVTLAVADNATGGKSDYAVTVYVNGNQVSSGTQAAQTTVAAIDQLTIGHADGQGVIDYKLASFNIYEGINTSIISNYETQQNRYKEKPINITSHTTNSKIGYPVIFSGNTSASSTQVLKVQIDNDEWKTISVENGNWTFSVPEGTYGEKTVKFSLLNDDSSVEYTEILNLDFVKEITISDLDVSINANSPVTGTLKLEENYAPSTYSVIAALFNDGKMLEYDVATTIDNENYEFLMDSYANVDGFYVKVFVVDEISEPELLSNVIISPNDASEPAETHETLTELPDSVNISATQYEGENIFTISLLASKKYINDGVVVVKTPQGNIDYINTVAVDADGYGAFKYAMNTVIGDQAYTVCSYISEVSGNKTFKIISQEAINTTLDLITGTAAENFETDILNDPIHSERLALDMTNYSSLDPQRKSIVNEALAGKTYSGLSDFKSRFAAISEEQAVLHVMENTSAENYASTLGEKNNFIGAKIDGLYTELSDDDKTAVFEDVKDALYYTSYDDLITAIKEKIAIYTVFNFTADEFVSRYLIQNYASEFGIADSAIYSGMDNKSKKKVIARVKAANPEIFTQINTAFEESVAFVSNPENDTCAPIMVVDFSNADAENVSLTKGITLSTGDGMAIEEVSIAGDGKYQAKSGSKVNYVELNGETSKFVINMGSPDVQEATLSFWANIDSSVIVNNGNSRVDVFRVKSGTTQTLASPYWLHASYGKSIAINGNFSEKYTSGDANFDAWNHYVFTYKWNDEGTSVTYGLYINGVYKNGNDQARDIMSITDDLKITIGGGGKFKIADVSYYDESMDARYIEDIYNNELQSHEPAAINLNYDNETVAYPYVLTGNIIKEGNQIFEISEDGTTYSPVTVNDSSWIYTFNNGEIGIRNIKFKIKNADGTTAEEITVPINFGYPLVLSNVTNNSVKVTNIRQASGSAAISADVIGVVYEGNVVKEVKTATTAAPIANGANETLSFTFTAVNPSTYIKYIAVDGVGTMNILAESVFYPSTATESSVVPADITVGNNGITADISYTPDTWQTVITVATTDKCKNAVVTVYDKNNELVYAGEASINTNGKCAVGYTPANVLTNENYMLKVKAGTKSLDTTFRYNTSTAISTSLLAVAGATPENFEQNILNNETHKYALMVDMEAFNALEQYYRNNVSANVAGKTYTTVASFKEAFLENIKEQTVLQTMFKSTTMTAPGLLKTHEAELGITLSEVYDLITSNAHKNEFLTKAVCGKQYASVTAFKTAFYENSMVSLFNFYQSLQIVENNIMQTYATQFNLDATDVTAYTGYTHERKIAVIDAMKITGVNSYSSLRTTFKSSLSAQPQGSQQGTSGGSGGSGGGSGLVITTPINIPDPVDEEYALAIADSIFKDLRTDHWAYNSIENLVKAGVLSGVGGGKFEPDSTVTREQFVKMILVALGFEIDENASCDFEDVDKNDWCYGYIATAHSLGVIEGVSQTQFGKGDNITRAQMCAIICRAVENSFNRISSSNEERNFTDFNSIPQYAREQVKLLSKAGIINGFDDGSFKPNDTATRAMAAKVIDNLLNNFK